MFADYISDNAWANRSHRGWTALASFTAQALAIAGLMVLPLLYTQGMPRLTLLGSVIAPVPPPAPGTPRAARSQSQVVSGLAEQVLRRPAPIPRGFSAPGDGDDSGSEPPTGPWETGSGGNHWGRDSMPDVIGTGMNPAIPPAPLARPPRVSHVMEGNLIRRVQPEYPPLARQARIQGAVVLRAVIDRDGKIQDLHVISGHPLLVQSAINAVRQWRYRPFFLNDQPVEVETQVTVNFSLAGG